MSRKTAVIGECMIELSERSADVKRGFSGNILNASIHVVRQVDPAALTVHYVAALGTGSFSQQVLNAWRGENVDISLTQRIGNRLPGLYYIKADNIGERTLYYQRDEAAARLWLEGEQSAVICEELVNFDYLYLSGISLAISSPIGHEKLLFLLRECRANDGKVIFGNNYRLRLWANKEETQQMCQQMLECTDTVFLTLDDEDALWGQQPVEGAIARTHNASVKETAVKRGANSYLVSTAGEGLVDVPAVKLLREKVIDTTAAGDSFSAGYLAVRLTSGTAEDAAKRGHLTASTTIQYCDTVIPHEAMPAQKQRV